MKRSNSILTALTLSVIAISFSSQSHAYDECHMNDIHNGVPASVKVQLTGNDLRIYFSGDTINITDAYKAGGSGTAAYVFFDRLPAN